MIQDLLPSLARRVPSSPQGCFSDLRPWSRVHKTCMIPSGADSRVPPGSVTTVRTHSRKSSRRPGNLQIEASRLGIHIQHFPGGIKAFNPSEFHCGRIDFLHRNTSPGYDRLIVAPGSCNRDRDVLDQRSQLRDFLPGIQVSRFTVSFGIILPNGTLFFDFSRQMG